jgi:hypothetical protein
MGVKMKAIQSLLHGYQAVKEDKDNPIIELLIRRGTVTPLKTPQKARNMVCQDCGSNEGYHWLHHGKHAWFCGNLTCLSIDSEITKKQERKKWADEFYRQLREPKKLTSGKIGREQQWDGK